MPTSATPYAMTVSRWRRRAAGARALEIVLSAYASAVTGRVVTLPLDCDSPVYQKGVEGIAELDVWEASNTKAAGLFGLSKVGNGQ